MIHPHLENLIEQYENSPIEFQATKYWEKYKIPIIKTVSRMDINDLQSGKHSILSSFGFSEFVFRKLNSFKVKCKLMAFMLWKIFVKSEFNIPYSIDIDDIREMSFRHCKQYSELTGFKDISSIEVSRFGNPDDIFEVNEKPYSMQFLGFYIRSCFAHKHIKFLGNEVIVELGSGSGHQIEVLKKSYQNLTILCFDLPAQIYLCEQYLSNSLGEENIVSSKKTIHWNNLSQIEKGKVHFFGNWQFPLLDKFKFDVFWNAASFGEMEPKIVNNYLSYINNNCRWVFLLQARHGKELKSVKTPIKYEDYNKWLLDYELVQESDAFRAHMRLKESGGYFQAIWKLKS